MFGEYCNKLINQQTAQFILNKYRRSSRSWNISSDHIKSSDSSRKSFPLQKAVTKLFQKFEGPAFLSSRKAKQRQKIDEQNSSSWTKKRSEKKWGVFFENKANFHLAAAGQITASSRNEKESIIAVYLIAAET
jgi:hypothetical protein